MRSLTGPSADSVWLSTGLVTGDRGIIEMKLELRRWSST